MNLSIPTSYRPFLRLGTCSWKYDSWKGLCYEESRRYAPLDYLFDYAKHFDTVEVDQWFWSLFPGGIKLPDLSVVRAYAGATPRNFRFSVKAPNALTLTHYYNRQPAGRESYAGKPNPCFLDQDLLRRFLDTLEPLEGKLGPIMFQFEYLNRDKMPGRDAFLERFGAFLDAAPPGYQWALETRNPNYLSEPFFQFLRERGLGFVYLEGYFMPCIGEVFDRFHPDTADFLVIRLHGGDRLEIEEQTGNSWDRIVSPKPDALAAAVRIAREAAAKKKVVYINANNHFEGCAPRTLERFLDLLREAPPTGI